MKRIGRGTKYSEVYIVKSKENNEKRAIKVFEKEGIRGLFDKCFGEGSIEDAIKQYIDKILKYTENMKKIEEETKCANTVVHFYEYFNNEDEFAIVMELCDENLKTMFLNESRGSFNTFNTEKIKEILIQLNNTFKIMNNYKIYKKNIKLENFLIKYDNEDKTKYLIKLVDYYYSKDIEVTDIGFVKYFYAPEIFTGEEYDEKCDLWSLGVLIYYLYFKKLPYPGKTPIALINNIKNLGQTNLQKTGNFDFDDLITKLLVFDKKKRISWNEYFKHPFFTENLKYLPNNNININDNKNNEKENQINKEDGKNIENKNIIELKNELIKEKEKNKFLEKELCEEKNKNKNLEEVISKLKNEIENLKENEKLKNISINGTEKESLFNIIIDKEKEIKELKDKLSRFPFELEKGEKLMVINFKSFNEEMENYSIICKNTDIFNKIENKLYEEYAEYYDTVNIFKVNGNRINKNKSLELNQINNNDTIIIESLDI